MPRNLTEQFSTGIVHEYHAADTNQLLVSTVCLCAHTYMHACINAYMCGVCMCVHVCVCVCVCVHARALRTVSTDKIFALYKLLSLSSLQDVDKKTSLNLICHVTYWPLPVPNHNQDCFWPNGKAGITQLSFIHLMDVSFHLREVFSSCST